MMHENTSILFSVQDVLVLVVVVVFVYVTDLQLEWLVNIVEIV